MAKVSKLAVRTSHVDPYKIGRDVYKYRYYIN